MWCVLRLCSIPDAKIILDWVNMSSGLLDLVKHTHQKKCHIRKCFSTLKKTRHRNMVIYHVLRCVQLRILWSDGRLSDSFRFLKFQWCGRYQQRLLCSSSSMSDQRSLFLLQVVFTDHSLFGFADASSILMNKVCRPIQQPEPWGQWFFFLGYQGPMVQIYE